MRWMFPNSLQQSTKVHDGFTIDLQFLDRRTAGRRDTANRQKVRRPGKVFLPAIFAGIVQRHDVAGQRIGGRDTDEFPVIASLTRQSQVRFDVASTTRPWRDMLHRERIGRIFVLAPAVFAAAAGAIQHQTSSVLRNCHFIRQDLVANRGDPSTPAASYFAASPILQAARDAAHSAVPGDQRGQSIHYVRRLSTARHGVWKSNDDSGSSRPLKILD